MLNTKQTLKNLHKKFPMMSLDELFEVLDCYVEESYFTPVTNPDTWKTLPTVSKPSIWYDNQVTSIASQDLNSDSHIIAAKGDIGISTRKF
jgi:hypothetical protein